MVGDLDGHFALRRQEDDIVAVRQLEIQLVDARVVQDVILFAVDKDVPHGGDLGFLVRAEHGQNALAVAEQFVHVIFAPIGVCRGRDADGGDAVAAAVDERDGDGRLLFAAAGER